MDCSKNASKKMPARGLYLAGTDTGVGKTAVAEAIVRQLVAAGVAVGVYKPVASGCSAVEDPGGDAARLWAAAGRPLSAGLVCPQVFGSPIAPPHAARAEGRRVDERLLRTGILPWIDTSDIVVVEGAGGLFSPLGETTLNADLVGDLGMPLVVVDAARLGVIGRTLMAVRAACAEGLVVAAVVLSQTERPGGDGEAPAGAAGIARAALSELAARLGPIPIGMLAHGAQRVEPAIDWMACGTPCGLRPAAARPRGRA